ncbi:MAG: SRPBCC family protein [Dehalococcoidia bacterium]
MRRLATAGILATAALWALLYRLGRTWGATGEERQRHLPGDELVPHAAIVTDHAVDISAPAERIWPWLLQVGWGRGGWYTYRWVDALLFPANAPSATAIRAELQQLAVGDKILDGPPEADCFFTVQELVPERVLVLLSHTHLPPQLRGRPGIGLNFSWTFNLEPLSGGRTRFHFRSRAAAHPWWLLAAYRMLLVPADFLMARSMCMGLKRRAEAEIAAVLLSGDPGGEG